MNTGSVLLGNVDSSGLDIETEVSNVISDAKYPLDLEELEVLLEPNYENFRR